MKDNFSSQSNQYARYRPVYPQDMYQYLIRQVPALQTAWDCGTGNGQVARELAMYFEQVYATDISQQQINEAVPADNIFYSVSQAESAPFNDNTFDLITVAQAIHWFDFDAFYKEVSRTLKNNGILAVIGYGLISTFPEADSHIEHFYQEVVGAYWDKERRYIDENYKTIPFPFDEIEPGHFENFMEWPFDHVIGYLQTWSAVKHYQRERGYDPVELIYDELKAIWGNHTRTVSFPLLLRVGKIEK